jgi:hypothetical protein
MFIQNSVNIELRVFWAAWELIFYNYLLHKLISAFVWWFTGLVLIRVDISYGDLLSGHCYGSVNQCMQTGWIPVLPRRSIGVYKEIPRFFQNCILLNHTMKKKIGDCSVIDNSKGYLSIKTLSQLDQIWGSWNMGESPWSWRIFAHFLPPVSSPIVNRIH